MEILNEFKPVIVALIALFGVIYSTRHNNSVDRIKALTESLVNLKKSGWEDRTEVNEAINNIANGLKIESQQIKPFPNWCGIGFVSLGIIGLAGSSFIPSAGWGLGLFTFSVLVSCIGIWMIPRCK